MQLTSKDKAKIRAHWPHLELRFQQNGTVVARKSKTGAYGVLYTPEQTRSHLAAV